MRAQILIWYRSVKQCNEKFSHHPSTIKCKRDALCALKTKDRQHKCTDNRNISLNICSLTDCKCLCKSGLIKKYSQTHSQNNEYEVTAVLLGQMHICEGVVGFLVPCFGMINRVLLKPYGDVWPKGVLTSESATPTSH